MEPLKTLDKVAGELTFRQSNSVESQCEEQIFKDFSLKTHNTSSEALLMEPLPKLDNIVREIPSYSPILSTNANYNARGSQNCDRLFEDELQLGTTQSQNRLHKNFCL